MEKMGLSIQSAHCRLGTLLAAHNNIIINIIIIIIINGGCSSSESSYCPKIITSITFHGVEYMALSSLWDSSSDTVNPMV